jgi:hypothetical protein
LSDQPTPRKREKLKIDLPFDEAIKTALKAPPPAKDETPPKKG